MPCLNRLVLLLILFFVALGSFVRCLQIQDQECEGILFNILFFLKTYIFIIVCIDVLSEIAKLLDESPESRNDPEIVRRILLEYCESVIGVDAKKEKLASFLF